MVDFTGHHSRGVSVVADHPDSSFHHGVVMMPTEGHSSGGRPTTIQTGWQPQGLNPNQDPRSRVRKTVHVDIKWGMPLYIMVGIIALARVAVWMTGSDWTQDARDYLATSAFIIGVIFGGLTIMGMHETGIRWTIRIRKKDR